MAKDGAFSFKAKSPLSIRKLRNPRDPFLILPFGTVLEKLNGTGFMITE
jgi:hypothetical protein